MEQATTRFSGNGAGLRTPEQIEREIEATRHDLADTVAAIVEKANLKKHAREKVGRARSKAAPVAIGVVVIATGSAVAWIVIRRRNETRLEKAKRWSRRLPDRLPDLPDLPDRPSLPWRKQRPWQR